MAKGNKEKSSSREKDVPAVDLLPRLERLARLVRAEAHVHGLNPAQWEALRYLSRCNRFSNAPGALTAYLDATKGTVSQTLKALERKGFIAKQPRPGMHRSLALVLTDKGRAILAADPLLNLAGALDGIGPKARRRMARAADRLIDAELTRRAATRFGTCLQCRFFREVPPDAVAEPYYCMYFEGPLAKHEIVLICVGQQRRAPSVK